MTPRRRRRWLRVLAWIGAVLLLVALSIPVAVGAVLSGMAGTRPQDLVGTRPPGPGLSYRSVFLTTRDGVRLSSWLLHAPAPRDCAVVVAHGLFRSRQEVLPRAEWLARQGCHTLLLDLRRHGTSGGDRMTLGFHERFDVVAGAEFLARAYPEDRLFLYGVSMGAAASAGAGVLTSRPPAGVALDSSFESIPAVVDRYARLFLGLPPFPAGDLTLVGLGVAGGFRPKEMDVAEFSAELGERGVPVLVMAGGRDQRAPEPGQRRVFEANGHPASRMITVEDATHGRPWLRDPEACQAALLDFFGLDEVPKEASMGQALLYDFRP